MKGGPARSDREPAWPEKVPEAGRDDYSNPVLSHVELV